MDTVNLTNEEQQTLVHNMIGMTTELFSAVVTLRTTIRFLRDYKEKFGGVNALALADTIEQNLAQLKGIQGLMAQFEAEQQAKKEPRH